MTFFRVDAHQPRSAGPSWPREIVQARAADVVLAASLFKPNAAGSHELTLGAGFGHRALLKARGAYLGERIVLGVTALHVHALSVLFGGRAARAVACWPRADVRAELVSPRAAHAGFWPALLLTDRGRTPLAELQVLHKDGDAWDLLTLLVQSDASTFR